MVLTNEFGKVVVLEPGVNSEFKIEKLHLANKVNKDRKRTDCPGQCNPSTSD